MANHDDYEPPEDSEDGEYNTPFNVGIRDQVDIASYARRWQGLPQGIKDIGFDSTTAEYIEDQFRPRFGLSREQTRAITVVVRDLLLVDLYLGDLTREIQSRLAVDESSAKTMADALFSEVLQPIRGDLKELHQDKFPERSKLPQKNP